MIYQIHWQFKDGKTEMRTQFEVADFLCTSEKTDIFRSQVDYAHKEHPLPDGAVFMICNEESRHFVGVIDEKSDRP